MKIKPTNKEFEILQVLWKLEQASVRTVHEIMHPNEEKGYTTTLKLMQIMWEKGLIDRKKEGKTHLYTSLVSEEGIRNSMLERFVDTVFNGSASSLVLQVLGNSKNTQKDLDEIREMLNQLDQKGE